MNTPDLQTYQKIWDRVHLTYGSGHIVSERGLQCALYAEIKLELPEIHIAIEPYCNGEHPDLVIVEDSVISDIFELKFKPGAYPEFENDVRRLSNYVGENNRSCYTSIDPISGYTGEGYAPPLPIHKDCRLHFVVVSRPDSLALDSELIANRPKCALYHWKGPSGEKPNWEVSLVNGPQV